MVGARAAPYMAGEGLSVFEDERAGRVLGFRRDAAAAEDGEAYRRFEEVFRGPRERVAELIEPYVPLLEGHGPVLDVGCGRGELLERLKAAGIEASGVDSDAGMAARARAAGLDVTVGDAIAHLESLPPGSLGAITAIHVIEHLPADALVRFFELAHARLRPGGVLVAETINPHAVQRAQDVLGRPHPPAPDLPGGRGGARRRRGLPAQLHVVPARQRRRRGRPLPAGRLRGGGRGSRLGRRCPTPAPSASR